MHESQVSPDTYQLDELLGSHVGRCVQCTETEQMVCWLYPRKHGFQCKACLNEGRECTWPGGKPVLAHRRARPAKKPVTQGTAGGQVASGSGSQAVVGPQEDTEDSPAHKRKRAAASESDDNEVQVIDPPPRALPPPRPVPRFLNSGISWSARPDEELTVAELAVRLCAELQALRAKMRACRADRLAITQDVAAFRRPLGVEVEAVSGVAARGLAYLDYFGVDEQDAKGSPDDGDAVTDPPTDDDDDEDEDYTQHGGGGDGDDEDEDSEELGQE